MINLGTIMALVSVSSGMLMTLKVNWKSAILTPVGSNQLLLYPTFLIVCVILFFDCALPPTFLSQTQPPDLQLVFRSTGNNLGLL